MQLSNSQNAEKHVTDKHGLMIRQNSMFTMEPFRNVNSTFERMSGLIEELAPGPHACLTTELLTILY